MLFAHITEFGVLLNEDYTQSTSSSNSLTTIHPSILGKDQKLLNNPNNNTFHVMYG